MDLRSLNANCIWLNDLLLRIIHSLVYNMHFLCSIIMVTISQIKFERVFNPQIARTVNNNILMPLGFLIEGMYAGFLIICIFSINGGIYY